MINITVTIPKKNLTDRQWSEAIAAGQRKKSVPALRKLFDKTTFGWSVKPKMGWSISRTFTAVTLTVYARGEKSDIWNLLNQGSPRHPIRPRSFGGMLHFRPGYRAATTPGQLQSRRAYRSGQFISVPFILDHPGFDARDFTELLAAEYKKDFAKHMQEAVDEAAKKK